MRGGKSPRSEMELQGPEVFMQLTGAVAFD